MLDIGASPARTIRHNASAPPKIPNLHSIRAIGDTTRDNPVVLRSCQKSELANNSNTATHEKTIHNLSLISLFLRSIKDANPSITIAARILTIPISRKPSNMRFSRLVHNFLNQFPKLEDQSYIQEI